MTRTTLGLILSVLTTPVLAAESRASTPMDTSVRVGITTSLVPAGMGGRIMVPAGPGLELFGGASVAAAVFTFDSTPTRFRGELGALYYPAQQIGNGLYIGLQGAGAHWTEPPLLGGSNIAFGPTIGGSLPLGEQGAALMGGIGMQAHFYGADYQTIGQGDGYQVLPQLDVIVVLPRQR